MNPDRGPIGPSIEGGFLRSFRLARSIHRSHRGDCRYRARRSRNDARFIVRGSRFFSKWTSTPSPLVPWSGLTNFRASLRPLISLRDSSVWIKRYLFFWRWGNWLSGWWNRSLIDVTKKLISKFCRCVDQESRQFKSLFGNVQARLPFDSI